MKKKTTNKVAKKLVPLTKSLGELMKDEDGFVTKETILKVGLSTIAALGMTAAMTDFASSDVVTHSNSIAQDPTQTNCVNHTNVTTHTSY